MSAAEIPYTDQLRAQAVHVVYGALQGSVVYGEAGRPCITMEDSDSVRQTHVLREVDGTRYLYTTTVAVSVSRRELV